MKINYDQDVDILRILLTDAAIEESDEVETGVIFGVADLRYESLKMQFSKH
jgi:uncharacterized protein YuzE